MKRTPGEWIASRDQMGNATDWRVGVVGGMPDEVAICEKRNAHLLAAAPDLFLVVDMAVAWLMMNNDADSYNIIDQGIEALAKARGKKA